MKLQRLLIALVMPLVLSSAVRSTPVVTREWVIPTAGPNRIFRPCISGDWITINRSAISSVTPVLAVDVYNAKTNAIYTANSCGNLPWCEFDGQQILWTDMTDKTKIHLFDVVGRSERVLSVSHGPMDPYAPVIWNNYVAYEGPDAQMYLLNTLTGEEKLISPGTGKHEKPQMGQDMVVWSDASAPGRRIRGYRISTGESFVVTPSAGDYVLPHTDGKTIVAWSNYHGVAAYDIATGSWTTISSNGYFADVDGGLVVYQNGNIIYGYDLSSKTTFRVNHNSTVNNGPSVSNGRVIWGTITNVYCAEVQLPEPSSVGVILGGLMGTGLVVFRRSKARGANP